MSVFRSKSRHHGSQHDSIGKCATVEREWRKESFVSHILMSLISFIPSQYVYSFSRLCCMEAHNENGQTEPDTLECGERRKHRPDESTRKD